MTDRPADIAVIVVNYGTPDLAIAAVESVRAFHRNDPAAEIHLVDNASPGDDAARLAAAAEMLHWGSDVRIWAESVNHGFGRGNNLVLHDLARRARRPSKVFLLNPDAQLLNDAVTILARFLDETPGAAVAGARIEQPDGRPEASAFRFPSAISEFASAAQFGPVSGLLDRWKVALPPGGPRRRVDWVSGAAVMLRFEVIESLGFFDPDFFLYYEEVDLMYRARRAGWEAWYVPEARAAHVKGAATGVQSSAPERRRRPAYWYRSWHTYFRKNHGRAGAILAALGWVAGAALNAVVVPFLRRPPAAPLNFLADFWTHAGRPLLGLRKVESD